MRGAYGSKYKSKAKGPKYGKRGIKASNSRHKRKCEKHDDKKGKDMNCFNCGKPSHFACDCTEPKIMFSHNHPSNLYVRSCLMLVESVSFFTINLGAIDHIANDRIIFMEFY